MEKKKNRKKREKLCENKPIKRKKRKNNTENKNKIKK